MKHITIVGAGFAALKAVKQLRQLSQEVEITLIAPRAELHYLPGIIWIPNGLRTREDLIVPLQSFFARHRVLFHQANVTGVSADGRQARRAASRP